MHGDLTADDADTLVEQFGDHRLVHWMHGRQARYPRQPACQRGRQRRLIELHNHRRPQPAHQLRPQPRQPFGQRSGQVPHRAGVGDGSVPARQFQMCGQCDRPGRLHLHHARAATQPGFLPGLLKCVDVLVEQAGRPAGHRTATGGDAVSAWNRVDRDIHQERTGAADQIGTHTAIGQLDQVGQIVQFTDNHLGGLPGRQPRPGSDAGCGSESGH